MPRFEIPMAYTMGYVVKAPYQEQHYITVYKQKCPICKEAKDIKHYVDIATECTDEKIEQRALLIKAKLEQMKK